MKKYAQWFASVFCALFIFTSLNAYADNNSSLSTTKNDSVITTKIKTKLAANSVTNPFTISVETNKGIVTLSGNVRSYTEAAAAVEVAESTDGVKDVDASKLVLEQASDQPITDAYITAKVKGMFIREKLFNSNMPVFPVKVETQNGVVTLSGNVEHKKEAKRAVELAKSVNGVTQVVSNIQIGKSA